MNGRVAPGALVIVAILGALAAMATAPLWAGIALTGLVTASVGALVVSWRRPAAAALEAAHPRPEAPTVVVDADNTGTLLFRSPAAPEALGWQVNPFTSLRLDEFIHGTDMHRVVAACTAVRPIPRARATVEVRARSAGAWRWVELTVTNGFDEPGVRGFVIDQTDVTDRRSAIEGQSERDLQVEAVYVATEAALGHGDTGSVGHDIALATRSALNAASCEIHRAGGQQLELVANVTAAGPLERRTTVGAHDIVGQCALRRAPVVELTVSGEAKEYRGDPLEAKAVAVPLDGDGEGVLCVRFHSGRVVQRSDVKFLATMASLMTLSVRQRDVEQEAFHRSRHDKLTGLVNRSVFFEQLQRALTRATRQETSVAVLLVDLDNFKLVNDSLGHAAGDTVLENVSRRLAMALRPGDVLARFGGDEFVVMTPGVNTIEQAVVAAERIRRAVSATTRVAGHDVAITASAGVAVASDESVSAEQLMQHADAAMHEAKQRGRERTEYFREELLDEAVTRLTTEAELREALTSDQLRVFYQPIVDLQNGRTVGAEALIRWAHPRRGLVAPGEFIPISEETGLIEEIGSWVIGQAARQAAAWEADGNPTQVSVNISERQLADPALVPTIAAALEDNQLDPTLFAVELTESAAMSDRAASFATLQAIGDLGVKIAIDDFGTGYSSLAYLRSLPVDTVKIDQTFIANIGRSGDDWAIAAAMIRLGQSLDKTVIAEGVETESQLELLQDLGCDRAQGFLFSPAVVELHHQKDSSPVTDTRARSN